MSQAKTGSSRASSYAAAARSLVGTPFLHQGRDPAIGLDCVGVLIAAARIAFGDDVQIIDRTDYSRQPDGTLEHALAAHCDRVLKEQRQVGDILVFRFRALPQHCAVLVDEERIVHAWEPEGMVVEVGIHTYWPRFLASAWRIR